MTQQREKTLQEKDVKMTRETQSPKDKRGDVTLQDFFLSCEILSCQASLSSIFVSVSLTKRVLSFIHMYPNIRLDTSVKRMERDRSNLKISYNRKYGSLENAANPSGILHGNLMIIVQKSWRV